MNVEAVKIGLQALCIVVWCIVLGFGGFALLRRVYGRSSDE